MKTLKRISTPLFAVILLMVMILSVNAAESSKDFEDPYDGSIVIYKYDTSKYENYEPGKGDGTKLEPDDKIGEDGAGGDVLAGDMTALANIPFTIEQVRIMTKEEAETAFGPGTQVDPTDPEHYVLLEDTAIDGNTKYVTDHNGTISFTGLPRGIYRMTEVINSTSISTVDPFLISLPMADPSDSTGNTTMKTVHVYPKNTSHTDPVVSKDVTNLTINDNTYNGRIIEWTIASEVPGTITGAAAAAAVEKYILTDTYGDYLTYISDSLKVYYIKADDSQIDLLLNDDYTVDTSMSQTFKITLTQAGRARLAAAIAETGKDKITGDDSRDYLLYVKYKTKVVLSDTQWQELIDDTNKVNITNEIVIDFTNDSGTSYQSKDTDTPILYQIKIHKYDGVNSDTSLAGAKFKIYTKLNEDGSPDASTVLKEEESQAEVEVVTDENGIACFNGLPQGTYYIAETKAPDGYKINNTPIRVDISSDDEKLPVYGTVVLEIPNYNDFTLPATGDKGTMIFTISGIVLIAAAGLMFLAGRKKRTEQK